MEEYGESPCSQMRLRNTSLDSCKSDLAQKDSQPSFHTRHLLTFREGYLDILVISRRASVWAPVLLGGLSQI